MTDATLEPSLDDIRSMLEKSGLGDYWEKLKKHVRPGFYMVPTTIDEEKIEVGSSKIGGRPDVPSTFNWPSWKGHPMSFLAQINLDEFPMKSIQSDYPTSGILYFFYVYDPDLWYENDSYDSDKKNNNVVYYTAKSSDLVRMEQPKGLMESQIFKSALIERKLELTIPDGDYLEANKIIKNKGDLKKYSLDFKSNFLETYDPGIGYRFLGHMTPLQYGGHPSDKILLFQADTNDEIGMEWDLSGLLYFFIEKDDFKKLFFKNVYTSRTGT
ncbi:YwqG family protein [Paenibacillus sp. 2TAB23]|uniref:YwqG family protein n=1 Tax=Paenibacillus sp. 2TAB23 TaxID=3233004 RepID=UPI003F99DD74